MTSPMFDLSGQVALITGAYRGLGFEIARGLARAGAHVVLNGRNPDTLSAARDQLKREGHAVDMALFDVSERDAVRAAVNDVEARHGHLDILVNNARIQRRAPLTEFAQADCDAVIATNLTHPFLVTQAALAGLR